MIEAIIELKPEKKLVGNRTMMSFAENTTRDLWLSFIPSRKKIINCVGTDLFSVEVYPDAFFDKFDTSIKFEKWAAVEVAEFISIPAEMKSLTVPEGLYAVFIHKGPASKGLDTYNEIFLSWLPASDFILDSRPHLAVMGEKYKHEDENSEEEIWIPVKVKQEK